jgi:EpsI family protein
VIAVSAGYFEIAEGCSGMRYVIVSLALAAFFALNWYQRWSSRLLLLAAAIVASLVANWIRVYALIVIGDVTDMQHYLIAESHDGFGWVVYIISMAPLLWFAHWLEAREEAAASRHAGASAVKQSAALASPVAFLCVGALVAAIVASPVLIRSGAELPGEPRTVALIPQSFPPWEAAMPAWDWQPVFQNPYLQAQEGFVGPSGDRMDVFVARYLQQQRDSKLIANANMLHPNWLHSAASTTQVMLGGEPRRIQELEVTARGQRRLVWAWYLVGGQPTHDRNTAKLLEIPALLNGRRDGAVIAISAPCSLPCDAARDAMTGFLKVTGPRLEMIADGRMDAAE